MKSEATGDGTSEQGATGDRRGQETRESGRKETGEEGGSGRKETGEDVRGETGMGDTSGRVDRSPARTSSAVAVLSGLVAAVIGTAAWGVPFAVGGAASLFAGVVRGSRGLSDLGGAFLLLGVLVSGGQAASPLLPLVGVAATVLAWDAAGNAIDVGRQLGRDAPTTGIEAVHLATSASIAFVTAGLGFGVYRLAAGGGPTAALVFFALAAIALSYAID